LEKELRKLGKSREQRRARRTKTGIPILSIIGYTNAGKSTLFNLLTKSQFRVEDKLFSTLDTATRRLRFPTSSATDRKTQDVVITDTVGFIKDLPRDLIGAFQPTFDELKRTDLLIHLVDISNPSFDEQIKAVEKTLSELRLDQIPRLRIFSKEDKLGREEVETICKKYDGVSISALRPESLQKLFLAIDEKLWEESHSTNNALHARLTNQDSFDISNRNFIMGAGESDGNLP
jgi:GTP-binding protein HflX